jgi:hypothetical protein
MFGGTVTNGSSGESVAHKVFNWAPQPSDHRQHPIHFHPTACSSASQGRRAHTDKLAQLLPRQALFLTLLIKRGVKCLSVESLH